MKKLALLLLAISALLSGCVAYEVPYRDGYRDDSGYRRDHREGDRYHAPDRMDRDRDGVSDRIDSRPNDPRRY